MEPLPTYTRDLDTHLWFFLRVHTSQLTPLPQLYPPAQIISKAPTSWLLSIVRLRRL